MKPKHLAIAVALLTFMFTSSGGIIFIVEQFEARANDKVVNASLVCAQSSIIHKTGSYVTLDSVHNALFLETKQNLELLQQKFGPSEGRLWLQTIMCRG